jgi:hypothetical protein
MCRKLIFLSFIVLVAAMAGQASGGDKASNPSPANGAVNVEPNVVLHWSPGTHAALHDVYLGTVFNDVNNATVISPVYKGRQASTTYNPGGLALGTTYYWRIDEVNSPTIWKGDVWSFTTISIGQLHNQALDYLFAHPPKESNEILITLEDYRAVIGVLKNFMVEVGFQPNDVNTAADSIINQQSDMGMFYLRDMSIYYGAPVVSDQMFTYQMQYLVEQGMITEVVAEKINNVAEMTLDGNEPNYILAYVQSLPSMEWTADEANSIAVFVDVYSNSYDYWKAKDETKAKDANTDWLEVAAASGAGALGGGGSCSGLGPWGVGLGALFGGACADYVDYKSQKHIAAPKPDVPFDGIDQHVIGIADAGLDISDRKLLVYNTQTTGEFGVKAFVEGSKRWNCVMQNPDVNGDLPTSAILYMDVTGEVNNVPYSSIGSVREGKVGDHQWHMEANFVDVTSYTVEAYNGNLLVHRSEGLVPGGDGWVDIGDINDVSFSCFFWDFHAECNDTNCCWELTFNDWVIIGDCGGVWVNAAVDRIRIIPESGSFSPVTGGLSTVSLMAKDIPDFTITEENISPCTGSIPGDLNGDCYVDFHDFAIMAEHWLEVAN